MSGLGIDPEEDGLGDYDGDLWEPDAVPPRVRTTVYLVGLIVGAVGAGAIGFTGALYPDDVRIVAAVVGSVTSVVATIAGGLGVAYRPTR